MVGRADGPTRRAVKAVRTLLLWAGASLGTTVAVAQCPDGTPPPCGRPARAAALPANSVAVLYLDNLSRDTADAFLADGLTEEIIIRLAQVPRLDVKSRYEVARVRHQGAQDPAALGRTLRASYLVMGSVQRAGDRVRLRYEVFRTATRTQVAGDVIDMASADLLTVESDIARQVAIAVTGRLLPDERTRLERRLTSDPVAYEEYLRGLLLLNSSFDEPALRGALSHFDRATARDSTFAAAYAGTAAAWLWLADAFVSPREGYGRARAAAARALALDSTQVLAYAMLAGAVLVLDHDAPAAERLAGRGIALDPRVSQAHLVLAWALQFEGRMDAGLEATRHAWEADSLFSGNGSNYAEALIGAHRFDRAAALLSRLRAVLPASDAEELEGQLQAARGDLRGAEHLLHWRYYGGLNGGTYVRALLARGDTAAARATVDSMLAARTHGYYNPVALAKAYAALGDMDRGIEWLGRAYDERTQFVLTASWDDELAPLRADPRWASLEARLRHQ